MPVQDKAEKSQADPLAHVEGKQAPRRGPPGTPPINQDDKGEPVGIAAVAPPGGPGRDGNPTASNPPVADEQEAAAGVDDLDEPGSGGPVREAVLPDQGVDPAWAGERLEKMRAESDAKAREERDKLLAPVYEAQEKAREAGDKQK